MTALAALIVWSLACAGWTSEWIAWSVPHPIAHTARRIVLCVFGAAISAAIAEAMARASAWDWRRRLVLGAALNAAGVALYTLLNYLIFYRFAPLWGGYSWRLGLFAAEGCGWVLLLWTTLSLAIEAHGKAREARRQLAAAGAPAPRPEPAARLGFRAGAGARFIEIDKIVCVKAERDYVQVHTSEQSFFFRATIAALEARLAPHGFLRPHRSSLVALNAIEALEAEDGGWRLHVRGGHRIMVSRRMVSSVRERLAAMGLTG